MFLCGWPGLVHASHSTASRRHRRRFLILLDFAHQGFGREQERGNRSRILEGRASDFRRIKHAGRDQIFIRLALGIEAVVCVFALADLLHDHSTLVTRIESDQAERFLECAADDGNTDRFVA